MSDESAKHFTASAPDRVLVPEPNRSLTLSITLHPNGQIDFSLPAGNKILSYGLLECARAQLDKTYLLEELKAAQASRGGIAGLVQRMNGGK